MKKVIPETQQLHSEKNGQAKTVSSYRIWSCIAPKPCKNTQEILLSKFVPF